MTVNTTNITDTFERLNYYLQGAEESESRIVKDEYRNLAKGMAETLWYLGIITSDQYREYKDRIKAA
jgi:hypothetical protein